MAYRITEIDPYLTPFSEDLELRMSSYKHKRQELLQDANDLDSFANAHQYFGFHRLEDSWVYREWAPAAEALYLTGDFNGWDMFACPMTKLEHGIFEVILPGEDALEYGQKVQTVVIHNGEILRRIPLYATRVVQDPITYLWCAEIDDTLEPYAWTDQEFTPCKTPFIYECHIGMAQEDYSVGSYLAFAENNLPRIKDLGYNTIQIMAIMEHPYYGSFGYQVSNFYAASSRYGAPD